MSNQRHKIGYWMFVMLFALACSAQTDLYGPWTEPVPVANNSDGIPSVYKSLSLGFMGPVLSGDGQRAYTVEGGTDKVWMSQRTAPGWSQPRDLNIPEHNFELWWLSVTNDGTLYMTMGFAPRRELKGTKAL